MGWILTVQEPAAWLPELSINEPCWTHCRTLGSHLLLSEDGFSFSFFVFDLPVSVFLPFPPSIRAAAGTMLRVLQDTVRPCGKAQPPSREWAGLDCGVDVSSDLGRPGTTLAQASPTRSRSKPPDPQMQVDVPLTQTLGLLCRGNHDWTDETHLVSSRPSVQPSPPWQSWHPRT